MEKLARLGYASKGVVYAIVGFLAAGAPFGHGKAGPDKNDALIRIASKPFGFVLLLVIAAGLAGYAFWRIVSGALDSERRGSDAKGLALRFGSIVRGLFYGTIAIEVLRFAQHRVSGSGSDAASRHWTARAMSQPFGRWLVAAAGLTLLGYAVYQVYRASTDKARRHLRGVSERMITISRFGIAARAVVFAVIAVSIMRAAVRFDPSVAKGTSGALRQIANFSPWVLFIVGVGLIAYGAYAFINAKYRVM